MRLFDDRIVEAPLFDSAFHVEHIFEAELSHHFERAAAATARSTVEEIGVIPIETVKLVSESVCVKILVYRIFDMPLLILPRCPYIEYDKIRIPIPLFY